MNNVQNQNGKALEEILAGPTFDAVKTTLGGLHNFKTTFSLFRILKKSFTIPLLLCHLE